MISRRALIASLLISPLPAFGRAPPGLPPDPKRSAWFANQVNMMGGSCCQLGDGHELDPGDIKYDPDAITDGYNGDSGWFVRLPDPSIETFWHDLNEPSMSAMPKVWVAVSKLKLRDPKGGMPPVDRPIVWYDVDTTNGKSYFKIYCVEPNPQF